MEMPSSKYVISDGNNYIYYKNGLQETTSNIDKAKAFDTYEKASNVIKSIRKPLKLFKWEPKSVYNLDGAIVEKESLFGGDIEAQVSIQNQFVDTELNNMISKIKEVENFTKQLKTKRDQYVSNYNKTNKEIIDIEHAAEFYNLNASQGYKIYKMLHEARINRRKYKDGIVKISYILDGNFEDCSNGKIDQKISNMDERHYAPRVLKELFNV